MYPRRVSVSWARAWTCRSVCGGGRKVLDTDCMWTVRFCISARSGSYAARALRSADGRAGAAGGIIYTSGVMRAYWLAGISSPTYISSRYCEFSISLLLIYIVLQLIKKVQIPTFYFVAPIFLHLQKFHA
jgi:hypothetical protein